MQNFIIRVRTIRELIIKGKFECFISFINTMNITMLISSIFLSIKKIISDRNNPYYSRNSVLVKIFKFFFIEMLTKLFFKQKDQNPFTGLLKGKISIINNFFDTDYKIKKKYKLTKKIKIIVVSKIEKQKDRTSGKFTIKN